MFVLFMFACALDAHTCIWMCIYIWIWMCCMGVCVCVCVCLFVCQSLYVSLIMDDDLMRSLCNPV